MKNKILCLLFGLLFIKMSFALVISGANNLQGDSLDVSLLVYNDTNYVYCYTLSADSSSSEIGVDISNNSYCLNPYSSTSLFLHIDAGEADCGRHYIYIYDDSDSHNRVYTLSLDREPCCIEDAIEVWARSTSICQDKKDYIFVNIRNKTNRTERVRLYADEEMLLPYFETRELYLDAYETKQVKLYLNTFGLAEGRRNVRLRIENESSVIYKDIEVDITDCETPDFYISAPSSCFYMDKGESKELRFRLVNLKDESQTIHLSLTSDLDIDYDYTYELDPNETKEIDIDAFAGTDLDSGRHKIYIKAWTWNSEDFADLCVYLNRQIDYRISLKTEYEGHECETLVIPIEIENTGDKDFSVSLSFDSSLNGVFSDNSFYLREGESKTVYLAVVPSEKGRYYGQLRVRIGDVLRVFNIRIDAGSEQGFVSNPENSKDLGLVYQSEKEITENPFSLEFEIINLSETTKEADISLDLPKGFYYDSPDRIVLNPNERKNVNIEVFFKGKNKAYHGEVILNNKRYPLTLIMSNNKQTLQTGLFSFAGDIVLGLIVLFIALLAITSFVSNNKGEVWTKR